MPRGGYCPGAGRPKGAKNQPKANGTHADVKKAAADSGLTPLEYMLRILNDPEADQARRDRMALGAAPYCHPRIADNRFGKKDAAAAAAETAGDGTMWGADLEYDA